MSFHLSRSIAGVAASSTRTWDVGSVSTTLSDSISFNLAFPSGGRLPPAISDSVSAINDEIGDLRVSVHGGLIVGGVECLAGDDVQLGDDNDLGDM